MSAYTRMLFVTSSKKIAPWILLFIGVILTYFSISLYVSSIQNNTYDDKPIQAVGNSLTPFLFVLPFLFVSSQIVFLTVHLFKESEKDGTELLIVSKPILRRQIIFSKLIVILIYIILINVVYFISTYFAVSVDKVLTGLEKFKAALSMALGSIVISLIILSMAIFFSTIFGSLMTLLLTIGIATLFPIFSSIIYPITSAGGVESYPIIKRTFTQFDNKGNMIKNPEDIYSIEPIEYENLTSEDRFKQYNGNLSYNLFSKVDIWYQWTKFYNMFNNPSSINDHAQIFQKNSQVPLTEYSFDINGDKYTLVSPNNLEIEYNILKNREVIKNYSKPNNVMDYLKTQVDDIYNKIKDTNINSGNGIALYNGLSLAQRLKWLNNILYNSMNNPTSNWSSSDQQDFENNLRNIDDLPKYIKDEIDKGNTQDRDTKFYTSIESVIANKLLEDKSDVQKPISLLSNGNAVYEGQYMINFKKVDTPIKINYTKDFINKGIVFAIWGIITLSLLSFAIFRYFKKDFK